MTSSHICPLMSCLAVGVLGLGTVATPVGAGAGGAIGAALALII